MMISAFWYPSGSPRTQWVIVAMTVIVAVLAIHFVSQNREIVGLTVVLAGATI